MRSSPAAPQVSAGGAPGRQQQFPCGLWRGPWCSRLSPCSPRVPHGADLHAAARGGAPGGAGGCGLEEAAAHGEPPQEQAPGRSCSPWRGAHAGAGGLGGAAARGGPVLEQFAPGGWTPWYGAVWEQVLKSCCLWAAPAGSVWEGRHPVGGTPRGAGAGRDREGVAEMKCQGLTAAPITCSSAPLGGRRWKRVDGGGRGRCF